MTTWKTGRDTGLGESWAARRWPESRGSGWDGGRENETGRSFDRPARRAHTPCGV